MNIINCGSNFYVVNGEVEKISPGLYAIVDGVELTINDKRKIKLDDYIYSYVASALENEGISSMLVEDFDGSLCVKAIRANGKPPVFTDEIKRIGKPKSLESYGVFLAIFGGICGFLTVWPAFFKAIFAGLLASIVFYGGVKVVDYVIFGGARNRYSAIVNKAIPGMGK